MAITTTQERVYKSLWHSLRGTVLITSSSDNVRVTKYDKMTTLPQVPRGHQTETSQRHGEVRSCRDTRGHVLSGVHSWKLRWRSVSFLLEPVVRKALSDTGRPDRERFSQTLPVAEEKEATRQEAEHHCVTGEGVFWSNTTSKKMNVYVGPQRSMRDRRGSLPACRHAVEEQS